MLYQPDFAQAVRIVAGQSSQYGHTFGGPARHSGAAYEGKNLDLHLLYTLNTSDPLLEKVRMQGITWLPLYYPMFYNGTDISYRLVSDTQIEILAIGETEPTPDFPYEGYPEAFPLTEVLLEPIPYETHKVLAFAAAAKYLSLISGPLSVQDRKLIRDLDWPATFAQIGGVQWLIQGSTYGRCDNPACKREKSYDLLLFAVVWDRPVPGVRLWGNDYSQIIYEICPECLSFNACNRCD